MNITMQSTFVDNITSGNMLFFEFLTGKSVQSINAGPFSAKYKLSPQTFGPHSIQVDPLGLELHDVCVYI